MKIKYFLIVLSLFTCIFSLSRDVFAVGDNYLSPEAISYSKKYNHIYIGSSTSPEIVVFDPQKNIVRNTIQIPSPVEALCIDEQKGLLYVAAKDHDSRVFIMDLEKGKVIKILRVGYHPSDIALTPDGAHIFITNQFSNDVSVIDALSNKELSRIPVIREPSALAVSPNGTFVAVANLLPAVSAMQSYISANVTLIDGESFKVIKNLDLPNGSYALKDIIFSPDGRYIYISHLIGRYNVLTSQIEKGWINTNAISIIDAKLKHHLTTVLLDDLYRGAANPNGLAFTENGNNLLIAISGTHELYMIDLDKMHERIVQYSTKDKPIQYVQYKQETEKDIRLYDHPGNIETATVGFDQIPNELGFLLPFRMRIPLKGTGPRQVLCIGENVYVTSYYSDGMDILDLNNIESGSRLFSLMDHTPEQSLERFGELCFHDASQCFQEWQSCASCHPGDGRVDGLNWDLMNDGFGNPKNTKSLLFSHETPPSMITGIRPDAETAVRAGFKYIQFHEVLDENAAAVDAYLKSLVPVPSPFLIKGRLSSSAKRGEKIFNKNSCNHCHSEPYFTDLQQHEMGKADVYDKQNTWDTPILVELWRTAPYLHNGRYIFLENVFHEGLHGLKNPLTNKDITDLVEYLLSL